MALQLVWKEFSTGPSHGGMQLLCDGESEKEPGQADSESTAVNDGFGFGR
jgi:hypothetical protein